MSLLMLNSETALGQNLQFPSGEKGAKPNGLTSRWVLCFLCFATYCSK